MNTGSSDSSQTAAQQLASQQTKKAKNKKELARKHRRQTVKILENNLPLSSFYFSLPVMIYCIHTASEKVLISLKRGNKILYILLYFRSVNNKTNFLPRICLYFTAINYRPVEFENHKNSNGKYNSICRFFFKRLKCAETSSFMTNAEHPRHFRSILNLPILELHS